MIVPILFTPAVEDEHKIEMVLDIPAVANFLHTTEPMYQEITQINNFLLAHEIQICLLTKSKKHRTYSNRTIKKPKSTNSSRHHPLDEPIFYKDSTESMYQETTQINNFSLAHKIQICLLTKSKKHRTYSNTIKHQNQSIH